MPPPKFSIVVACYNQEHFVQAAVESAISQPYLNKEVIVVDDGSSDRTCEVLEAFGDSIQFVRFAKNQGPLATRNHGASLAAGEYLVFLDGDDVLMPWTLEVYERLLAADNAKIILGLRHYFEGDVPRVTAKDLPDRIDFVRYACWLQKDRTVAFGASNLVVRRDAFSDVGGWSLGIFHLDVTDLLLKLGLAGTTLVVLNPETVWYRRHSGSVTRDVEGMLRCAKVLLSKEWAGEYPGGRKYLLARGACLGGPILFWVRRAIETGLYRQALKLVVPACFVMLAALLRRLVTVTVGRHAVGSIELHIAGFHE